MPCLKEASILSFGHTNSDFKNKYTIKYLSNYYEDKLIDDRRESFYNECIII